MNTPAPTADPTSANVGSKKILMIDDDPATHVLLRAIMEFPPPIRNPPILTYDALSFEGGLIKFEQIQPDIVLLDLKLSEQMRGISTIDAMRRYLADRVPVVIITGSMEPGDSWTSGQLWREARFAGACGWIRKDNYLRKDARTFLLHELHDAMLEYSVRKSMGVVFNTTHDAPALASTIL